MHTFSAREKSNWKLIKKCHSQIPIWFTHSQSKLKNHVFSVKIFIEIYVKTSVMLDWIVLANNNVIQ